MFAYTITIPNTGSVTAQLISRHWIITDAENRCRKCGAGRGRRSSRCCKPGESFEYTSGTAIATPVGHDARHATRWWPRTARAFEAPIPEFTLSVPRVLH